MANSEPRPDLMTTEEFQGWLKQEIRDSAKAHELRIKDATAFVTAYTEGKLTAEEAQEHLYRYDRRWGEALFGTTVWEGTTDSDILTAIDRSRHESFDPQGFRRGVKNVNRPQGNATDKSR
jgi:hypothetical protein